MRRSTHVRVPTRPTSLAFEPLEPRELLAADAAACWSPDDVPVADDFAWTFDDSWISLDPPEVATGSEGPVTDGWWVDDASLDSVAATVFDGEPFDTRDAGGVQVTWLFEPLPSLDGDVPVIPFLPPPDAVEATSLPIVVVPDAVPVDVTDVWCADVVLCTMASDTVPDEMSDTASETASDPVREAAARPAASSTGAGRFTGWGAFAFQAVGGSTGAVDGSATGGPADGQPGSGRPRLRLPFRPMA